MKGRDSVGTKKVDRFLIRCDILPILSSFNALFEIEYAIFFLAKRPLESLLLLLYRL